MNSFQRAKRANLRRYRSECRRVWLLSGDYQRWYVTGRRARNMLIDNAMLTANP